MNYGIDLLIYEFKGAINRFLADTAPSNPIRSLADLIAYNEAHPDTALRYGQDILLRCQNETSGLLTDPAWLSSGGALERND